MAHVEKVGNVYYIRYKNECGRWRRKSCGKNATRKDADYLEDHGMRKFKSFDREAAQDYLDYRKNEGMSPRTIKEERRLLNNFFKWAMENHFCIENPIVSLLLVCWIHNWEDSPPNIEILELRSVIQSEKKKK